MSWPAQASAYEEHQHLLKTQILTTQLQKYPWVLITDNLNFIVDIISINANFHILRKFYFWKLLQNTVIWSQCDYTGQG